MDDLELSPHPSLGSTLISSLFTLLVAGLITFYFANSGPKDLGAAPHIPHIHSNNLPTGLVHYIRPINRIELPRPTSSFTHGSDSPVIYIGSVVSTWPSRKSWTLDTLSTHQGLGFLDPVIKSDSSYMSQYPSQVAEVSAELANLWSGPDTKSMGISGNRFAQNIQNNASDTYLLYHGPVPESMLDDISPHRIFSSVGQPLVTPNFWMASQGLTVYPTFLNHYKYHVQLLGKTRWLLVAPEDAENTYLLPGITQHGGQSRIVFNASISYKQYPLLKEVQFYEVELNEGEIIYIPPYWVVQVEAMSPCVAVTFEPESTATLTPFREWFALASQHEIDFHEFGLYVITQMERLKAPGTSQLVHQVERRFSDFSVPMDQSSCTLPETLIPKTVEDSVQSGIFELIEQHLAVPIPIKELHFKNYIEQVAFEATGHDIHKIPSLLKFWALQNKDHF